MPPPKKPASPEDDVDPPAKPESMRKVATLLKAKPAPAAASSDEAYNPCPVCGTHLVGATCAVDGYRVGSESEKPEAPGEP